MGFDIRGQAKHGRLGFSVKTDNSPVLGRGQLLILLGRKGRPIIPCRVNKLEVNFFNNGN